jgi:hypothetical protein
VDAKGYSTRIDIDQQELQRAIVAVCDAAARAAALHRDAWHRQGTGDGELAVLPAEEQEDVVVDHYVRELVAELDRYNGRLLPSARLRLRVAIHFGRLSKGSIGHAGPAPIAVARLVDSAILHAALAAAPGADLALLVSAPVFDDTIATLGTTLRPVDFRRVRVTHKEFSEDAWLWVPGHDAHTLPLGGEVTAAAPGGSPPAEPRFRAAPPSRGPGGAAEDGSPVVHNTFQGRVDAPGAVFGMSFGGDR